MSRDVIDRLVRPANPVPDPRLLAPGDDSALPAQRRESMQTQVETDQVRESKGRGVFVGIAAAIVVIVGVALFQLTEDSNLAAGSTPEEIATAYLEVYSAFDVEGVESMLAPDAQVLPWESYEVRDWRSDLKFLEAAGFQLTPGECTELPALSDGVRVTCEYDAHGLGSDQIGEGPFGGNVFRLVLDDGLVVSSDMGFNFTEFAGAMWFPFQNWITQNHPEDFDTLYVNDELSRQTDDAIALWEQRIAEYVDYVNDQS